MTRDRFTELYRPTAAVLAAYARNLTKNQHDAEDLLQETLLKAWAARRQFADGTNFRAWLCTIMHNEFADQERVRRDRARALRRHLWTGSTHRAQEIAVEYARVVAAIRSLRRPMRRAIALQLFQLTYLQCAHLLGCAEGTVRSRLSRARAALAAKLDR